MGRGGYMDPVSTVYVFIDWTQEPRRCNILHPASLHPSFGTHQDNMKSLNNGLDLIKLMLGEG